MSISPPINYPAFIVSNDYTSHYNTYPYNGAGPYLRGDSELFIVMLKHISVSLASVTVFRSTNLGKTWTEMDTGNRKAVAKTSRNYFPFSVFREGDILFIAHSATIVIDKFNMVTALWDTQVSSGGPICDDVYVSSGDDLLTDKSRLFLTRLSTGDFIILYQATNQVITGFGWGRVRYAKWDGSTWSNFAVFTAGSGDEWGIGAAGLVLGPSDRVHFFAVTSQTGSLQIVHVSRDSDGTLNSQQIIDSAYNVNTYIFATYKTDFPVVSTPIRTFDDKILIAYAAKIGTAQNMRAVVAQSIASPAWLGEDIPFTTFLTNTKDFNISPVFDGAMLSLTQGELDIGLYTNANIDESVVGAVEIAEKSQFLLFQTLDGTTNSIYLFWILHSSAATGGQLDAGIIFSRRNAVGQWSNPQEVYQYVCLHALFASPASSCDCPISDAIMNVLY